MRQTKTEKIANEQESLYNRGFYGNVPYQTAVSGKEDQLLKEARLKENPYQGTAYYLDYPNFKGSAGNVLKIGNFDIGKKILGTSGFPAGHGATILVTPEGNATYYEYGRYRGNQNNVFGKTRPTVQGGNWRKFTLPNKNESLSDSAYLASIYKMLPDAKASDMVASVYRNFNTDAATKYINEQANDENRAPYSMSNTCATQASNVIDAGHKSYGFHPLNYFIPKTVYDLPTQFWNLIPGSS